VIPVPDELLLYYERELTFLRQMGAERARGEGSSKKKLRFQIEGVLKMDPAPEQISFDTVLQLTTGEYQVKGDSGA
jgi:type VI secretion system protein ImpF